MATLHPSASAGKAEAPPPARPDPAAPEKVQRCTFSPGLPTALRCPMCEGPVFTTAEPGGLTCPACAARPAPDPEDVLAAIGLAPAAPAGEATRG